MRVVLGIVLRGGVLFSAAIVFAGGVLYLLHHGSSHPAYGRFAGEPSELRNIGAIARGAAGFNGRSLIQLGVLLLIATPISRVTFSLVEFGLERNWRYVAITAIVLALLAYSLTRS
jgi:uncharacterized membrane protein